MYRMRIRNPGATLAALVALAAPAAGSPAAGTPRAPLNFTVQAYARGLEAPQSLLVLPNGDLLIAERRPHGGRVTLLRDAAGKGVADREFPLLDAERRLHGLALRRSRLYVARSDGILSCPFLVGQTRLHGGCRLLRVDPLAREDLRTLRSLQLSRDETGLYVSVGLEGADEAAAAAGEPRAPLELVAPDSGAARRLGALAGNPLALAVEPISGRLWIAAGAARGPDPDAAVDFLAALAEGAPLAHTEVALEPRATPRGLAFYQRQQFPQLYRGGAFVAEHGAPGGPAAGGAKVVFVPFAAGRPAGAARAFLTGFDGDADGAVHGRPAAVAVATDGSLLVADDIGNTIWRVSFRCAACTPDPPPADVPKPALRP